MGRVIRPDKESDGGFTLVEVVLAIAILSVGIAAAAAGLSLAASARSDNDGRSLAVEIANEALQRAEAFGCGLPIDYNGVSAADRLDACDYNGTTQTGGAALADVDYTIERDGRSFDVEIRMRWHSIRPVPDTYDQNVTNTECQRRERWNSNTTGGGGTQPIGRSDPTLLSRRVTVTAPDDTSVALESTEAVYEALAGTNLALLYLRGYEDNVAYYKPTGTTEEYRLHADDDDCAVFVYMAGTASYEIGYYQSGTFKTVTYNTCTPAGTPIVPCSEYSNRP